MVINIDTRARGTFTDNDGASDKCYKYETTK